MQRRSVLSRLPASDRGDWLIVACCGEFDGETSAFLLVGRTEPPPDPPRPGVTVADRRRSGRLPRVRQRRPGPECTVPVPNAVPIRPDMVLLLADDLSLSAMDVAANVTLDDGSWFMPNFRRYILDKAVEFRQAFSPNPLCCPARATLLTGQYSHNHGALSNSLRNGTAMQLRDGSDSNGDGRADGDTVALALQRAGYRTAHVGKYLNGYGMSLHVPAGAERRALQQFLVDRYGGRANVVSPMIPETGRAYRAAGMDGVVRQSRPDHVLHIQHCLQRGRPPDAVSQQRTGARPGSSAHAAPARRRGQLSDRRHTGPEPQVPRQARPVARPAVPVDQHARAARGILRLGIRPASETWDRS